MTAAHASDEKRAADEHAAEGMSAPPAIDYGSGAFDDLKRRIEDHLERRERLAVVFLGGGAQEQMEGLGELTRQAAPNVYQYNTQNLMGERNIETQANLRAAFDRAKSEAALLFFKDADALFETAECPAEGKPTGELTPADYFFQRIDAFAGVSVLGVRRAEVLRRAAACNVDAVVRF